MSFRDTVNVRKRFTRQFDAQLFWSDEQRVGRNATDYIDELQSVHRTPEGVQTGQVTQWWEVAVTRRRQRQRSFQDFNAAQAFRDRLMTDGVHISGFTAHTETITSIED